MNSKVDDHINQSKQWKNEMNALRTIILDCQLAEDFKWGKPCYSFQGKNIVIIQGFKDYFALLFFKGGLMKDSQNLLVKMGENTQAGRQMRFENVQDILDKKSIIKDYIFEAVEIEERGEKVEIKREATPVPEEFQIKLNDSPELKSAFESLTPGRQRAYLIHFSAPKQSKTRESRIEKSIPNILDGKGIND
ncbi:YdeI/OmpD-associated family protein [Epilithonimonas zeae]|uniref:YdeI/OmpD-associated family protein n=1 Tax=Epilithonimonas zeae TaxID=1416779 RepID=UPI002010961D|nr:YdeI/OmpD-associated family protein [Epilithonimonas zeae]UQB70218.1 YdeI/OmpD-associated family protein [Epilithonimonas zeae]